MTERESIIKWLQSDVAYYFLIDEVGMGTSTADRLQVILSEELEKRSDEN